jgi:hypothetical protein
LSDNLDLGNVGTDLYKTTILEDKSERGYCLRDAAGETEDPYYSCRMLNPKGVRIIRLMINTVLYAASCALGESWDARAQSVFNRAYYNPSNVNTFLAEHFTSGWNQVGHIRTWNFCLFAHFMVYTILI